MSIEARKLCVECGEKISSKNCYWCEMPICNNCASQHKKDCVDNDEVHDNDTEDD